MIKLVADKGTGRLLGGHVVAADGGEIIQGATLAIRFGLTTHDIVEPHTGGGTKLAALTFRKDVGRLSCYAS